MWLRALCVAFVLMLFPASAGAQTTIDLSLIQDVARAKAEEGLALFAEEKWAAAYERFRLAEELFHAPTLGLHMGHCKRHLGELLAARAHYKRVAEEEPSDDAPPAFVAAITEAAAKEQELDAEIPRVTIEVSGIDASDVRVTLDGVALSVLSDIELDPGDHHIDAVAPGVESISRDFELEPGARERIPIVFKPVVAEPAPRVVQPARPPPEPGSLVPAFIAYGFGAAGLITGAIAGGIALGRIDAIKSECDGNVCPDRLVEDANDAQLTATVSNIGFIVLGAGAIAGTILLFVRPGGEDAPEVSLRAGPSSILFEVKL